MHCITRASFALHCLSGCPVSEKAGLLLQNIFFCARAVGGFELLV